MQLQPREDVRVIVDFSCEERKLYDFARDQANWLLRQALDSKDGKSNHHCSILQAILRLRQISNHNADLLPPKVRHRLQSCFTATQPAADPSVGEEYNCEVCGEAISDQEMRGASLDYDCLHIVCPGCASEASGGKVSKKKSAESCPICFPRELKSQNTQKKKDSKRESISSEAYRPSSKVKALLKNLREEGSFSTVKR